MRKTTLIKLLQGFYEPTRGSIKVGGVNLSDINPHTWRAATGSVMQDSFIFSDTIEGNIAFNTDEADKERMKSAARMARIDDFVESLPLGYDTVIGMEGKGVSQGQRQRILIARAIYKNPEYISSTRRPIRSMPPMKPTSWTICIVSTKDVRWWSVRIA